MLASFEKLHTSIENRNALLPLSPLNTYANSATFRFETNHGFVAKRLLAIIGGVLQWALNSVAGFFWRYRDTK